MNRKVCNFCTQAWSSQPTYHDSGFCPARYRHEERMAKMAKQPKTRAEKAEKAMKGVEDREVYISKNLRLAEALLFDLEDRSARREARARERVSKITR